MRLYLLSFAVFAFSLRSPEAKLSDKSVDGFRGPRRPVALVVSDDGRFLFVANGRSGTVSALNTETLEVQSERAVGESLKDLAALPGVGLLTLDEGSHELLLLGRKDSEVHVTHRLQVSPYPSRLAVSREGRRAFVSSSWSRRLDVIDFPEAQPKRRSLDFPFAPREMLPLAEGNRLIVADAFGGHLAIVDVERGTVERVIEIPGHNIRGLALEGNRLLLTHQRVEKSAHTDREALVWGVLITNALLSLDLEDLLEGEDALGTRRVFDLGGQVIPSGDPERLIVTDRSEVVVTLAGVGRVAIGMTSWPRLDHVKVGRRPTAVALGPDGRLFVANTHSDSIAVIDVPGRQLLADVALGPPSELGARDRGEVLFYDAGLSLRGWMSCHSCHTEGHTSGILSDTQGDGSYGAPKRVPSLLGVGRSGPWAWNGQMKTLPSQIEKSLRSTLHASPVSAEQVAALEAYLETLEPPTLEVDSDPEAVHRGEALFRERCTSCHTPPAFTSAAVYDVGLADEMGNRRFNPPSLRGVTHRTAFFHDGRAHTLEDVFTRHRHPAGEMHAVEVKDLIAYLKAL